jgi:hypothetical protein
MREITGMLLFSQTEQRRSSTQRKPLQPPANPLPVGRVRKDGEEAEIRYDTKSGNYLFRWKGTDGRPKQAIYTPPWRVLVVVIAEVQHAPQQTFLYRYTVQVLPDSPQSLRAFTLLTDAPVQAVRVVQAPRGPVSTVVGTYPKHRCPIVEFGFMQSLRPSERCQVEFRSLLPPGINSCYALGEAPLMRVPEELPSVLEALLPRPGADEARGLTIVPVQLPSIERLVQDWQVALAEGWVERRVWREVANRLQQLLAQLRRGQRDTAKQIGTGLHHWLLARREACLPEAFALISETLPFVLAHSKS